MANERPQKMNRLCPFTGEHASEILEDIFIGLERMADSGHLDPFEMALYKRLKAFEVNSREAYENFYNTLAGKTE